MTKKYEITTTATTTVEIKDITSGAETIVKTPANQEKAQKKLTIMTDLGGTLIYSKGGCLTPEQMSTLFALVEYMAVNENFTRETIQSILEARFAVTHLSKIAEADYEEAVNFLVSLTEDDPGSAA